MNELMMNVPRTVTGGSAESTFDILQSHRRAYWKHWHVSGCHVDSFLRSNLAHGAQERSPQHRGTVHYAHTLISVPQCARGTRPRSRASQFALRTAHARGAMCDPSICGPSICRPVKTKAAGPPICVILPRCADPRGGPPRSQIPRAPARRSPTGTAASSSSAHA